MMLRMFADVVPESEVLDTIPTQTLEWADPVKFLHEGTPHMDWEKFAKPLSFGKKHRTFKELREPIPTEFVKPKQSDPWKNKSYNSLEAFMS